MPRVGHNDWMHAQWVPSLLHCIVQWPWELGHMTLLQPLHYYDQHCSSCCCLFQLGKVSLQFCLHWADLSLHWHSFDVHFYRSPGCSCANTHFDCKLDPSNPSGKLQNAFSIFFNLNSAYHVGQEWQDNSAHQGDYKVTKLQLWTTKLNNFDCGSGQVFCAKPRPDLDSGRWKTSKNTLKRLFPWGFWSAKFLKFGKTLNGPFLGGEYYIMCYWSQRTASIDIITHCESNWRFRSDKQPQPTQQRTTKRWVVVCLHSTRGEIAYGEGDASTPKEWCRCRQRALLMTRSDWRQRGMKTGAFLKPRKS